jgi:hypothetical protein
MKGRKGYKGRKSQVSFPCAADSSIQPSGKHRNLHARRSEAEPRWCILSGLLCALPPKWNRFPVEPARTSPKHRRFADDSSGRST